MDDRNIIQHNKYISHSKHKHKITCNATKIFWTCTNKCKHTQTQKHNTNDGLHTSIVSKISFTSPILQWSAVHLAGALVVHWGTREVVTGTGLENNKTK